MASYTISPIWGAGAQLFDNSGRPLSGGKIYTYQAGTTTPAVTYTTPTGSVANSNPIVADSAGRLTDEIWFPVSGAYKFVLKTTNDVTLATYDNIPTTLQPPITNDASSISYEQGYEVTAGGFTVGATYLITSIGNTDFVAIGAAANSVGVLFTATGVGSGTGTAKFSRTLQTRLQEYLSVKDFGAVGDGITDDTAAIQAAHATGKIIFYPYGTYKYVGYFPECEGGIIGEGWSANVGANTTNIVFYNCTSTTKGAFTIKTDSPVTHFFSIENIAIKASSWDVITGCLGYGLDIGAPVKLTNILVEGFKKSNIFIHHMDPINSSAPYESILTNVISTVSGQYGCYVGAGASLITFINYEGKWNGATTFGVIPSVAGNYDGFYVTVSDDGVGYTNSLVEGLSIIGGDCSYNSRYGWNLFQVANSSSLFPAYAEGNLATGGYQSALGNGFQTSIVYFGNVDSAHLYQNAYALSAYGNLVYAKGQLVGYGGINYLLATSNSYLVPSTGLASGTIIAKPNASGFEIARAGTGSYLAFGAGPINDLIGITDGFSGCVSLPRHQLLVSDAVSVSNVTNNGSGAIRVVTSSAHGLSTGSKAQLLQAIGVPNVAGFVTVIDAITFDFVGSTFSGTYTSGGTVRIGPLLTYTGTDPTGSQGTLGDVVWNTSPLAGSYIGWVCTATGNPGTWKTFGAISA